MNKIWILIVAVLVCLGLVYNYLGHVVLEEENENAKRCLVASGYFWNGSELACVRGEVPEGVGGGKYQVNDFKSCVAAGYPILNFDPRQCEVPRGDVFYDDMVE